jgi:hypothetical protein
MVNSITPPPELVKKFSTEARDESNKRNGTGYLKTFAKLCIEWANSKSTSNDRQIRSSEITPPPELVQQWIRERDGLEHLATQAAQWGSDQELEACCEWLAKPEVALTGKGPGDLRAARRPKPPSLKERSLQLLETYDTSGVMLTADQADTIRRALEALDD